MPVTRKRTAEIIAFWLGMDLADMKEYRYQATRTSIPVYAIGDKYFCCPTDRQKLPEDFGKWEPIGTAYDRTVYASTAEEL